MTTLAHPAAPHAARVPALAELLARAAALVPRLRERARQAESARRIPDETIHELLEANLFEVQKPASFGGYELGLAGFVELVAMLGRGCGSTAWVYGVTAERAWLLAKFPARAQHDVWDANPGAHLGLSWDLVGTMWGQHALGLPLASAAY